MRFGRSNTAGTPAGDQFAVYERQSGWSALDLCELWKYRELLLFLTWRDILVRYKQAVLGVAWAIMQSKKDAPLTGAALPDMPAPAAKPAQKQNTNKK